MKTFVMFVIAVSVFSRACESPSSKTPTTEPEGFGQLQASDLVVEMPQDEISIEWGVPAEVPVRVSWAKDQKYAVQIEAAPETPAWLKVETRPVILDPPGEMTLIVHADVGAAKLGKRVLVLEASAYGLKEPEKFEIEVEITRQSGDFDPVLAAPVTVECRNICGKFKDGRVTFYDVLKEKGQSCREPGSIPEDQRIGGRAYALSSKGFGYGRTCRVACCYESSGGFSIVNLGFFDYKIPRGEALMQLRNVSDCWLSADNTVALIMSGSSVVPYDVLSGQPLGDACRIVGQFNGARLDGENLKAFASYDCEWVIR